MFIRRFIYFLILGSILFFSLYNYYQGEQTPQENTAITISKTTPKPTLEVPITTVGNSIENTPLPTPQKTVKPTVKPTIKPTPTPLPAPKVAFSIYYANNGSSTVLYNSHSTKVWTIASITKLMTALIVKKYFPEDVDIPISKTAVDTPAVAGHLQEGEIFARDELLYPLLIESSNDAAYAFAEKLGVSPFISLMNAEALKLGMTHTHFVNASGLDSNEGGNSSTAEDLGKLALYLYKNYPDILAITRLKEYSLHTAQGDYDRTLKTTDYSLSDTRITQTIIGGKTGETDKAMQNLLLITEAPNNNGIIVSIIMGSASRFDDMANLIKKAVKAKSW